MKLLEQARHEYLLTQPLDKEDIQKEAALLLGKLQEPKEPNSPSGTHFLRLVLRDASQKLWLSKKSKDCGVGKTIPHFWIYFIPKIRYTLIKQKNQCSGAFVKIRSGDDGQTDNR